MIYSFCVFLWKLCSYRTPMLGYRGCCNPWSHSRLQVPVGIWGNRTRKSCVAVDMSRKLLNHWTNFHVMNHDAPCQMTSYPTVQQVRGKKQHSWPPHTAKSWRKWELDIKSNVEPKFSEKRPSSCSNSWGSIFLFKPFHPQKNWKVAVSPVAAGWIPTSRLGGAASNSFWSAVFQGPLRYPLVS